MSAEIEVIHWLEKFEIREGTSIRSSHTWKKQGNRSRRTFQVGAATKTLDGRLIIVEASLVSHGNVEWYVAYHFGIPHSPCCLISCLYDCFYPGFQHWFYTAFSWVLIVRHTYFCNSIPNPPIVLVNHPVSNSQSMKRSSATFRQSSSDGDSHTSSHCNVKSFCLLSRRPARWQLKRWRRLWEQCIVSGTAPSNSRYKGANWI